MARGGCAAACLCEPRAPICLLQRRAGAHAGACCRGRRLRTRARSALAARLPHTCTHTHAHMHTYIVVVRGCLPLIFSRFSRLGTSRATSCRSLPTREHIRIPTAARRDLTQGARALLLLQHVPHDFHHGDVWRCLGSVKRQLGLGWPRESWAAADANCDFHHGGTTALLREREEEARQ
jgi:hypothetical protein